MRLGTPFPAPRGSQGMNQGKMCWLGPQRQEKPPGTGAVSTSHWAKGRHWAIPSNVGTGPEPSQVLFRPFHHTHLSSCQHRFPKFTWGPVYFFFIFKSTIVLRSVFLLAKVTAGPTLFRVSCLPSLLQPLSRSLVGPTPLIFGEGRLVFPPPYKRETPVLPLCPSAFFEMPPRPCYCWEAGEPGINCLRLH